MAGYEVEWHPDAHLPSQQVVARIGKDRPAELFLYPQDGRLPGLAEAARPDSALRLVNRHVLFMPARLARVELVRYRPGYRAVLRHRVGKTRFYARVVRPDAMRTLLGAHKLIGHSGFVVPRLAGYWANGGVVWLSEIPGRNLRRNLRKGRMPDPHSLLDGLERLWSASIETHNIRPFDLAKAYLRAERSFRHHLRDSGTATRSLNDAAAALAPFVHTWRPTGIAHNDFYDDQMLVLRDGRVALVDFEEAGPGDPLLDVGNFLAHLRWSSCFARNRHGAAVRTFHRMFQQAALDRFGWGEGELALREAVCLFRTCTNAIRHPRADWRDRLETGLSLVNEALGQGLAR